MDNMNKWERANQSGPIERRPIQRGRARPLPCLPGVGTIGTHTR